MTTPLVKNYYDSGTPALLNLDRITDSIALFGDEEEDMACMVVHSKTKANLRKLKTSDGMPLLQDPKSDNGGLPRINGIPVMVSDRMPVTGSAVSAVTSAGTTPPTVSISGTPAPTGAFDVSVEVTTGGSRGTAVIKYTVDGGITYTTDVTTAATVELFDSDGVSTGITIAMASGTYATDNVYTFNVIAKHTSLILKKNSLVLWYAGQGMSIDEDKDISRDTKLQSVHVYWAAHRYVRMPGKKRPGVVMIRHN